MTNTGRLLETSMEMDKKTNRDQQAEPHISFLYHPGP